MHSRESSECLRWDFSRKVGRNCSKGRLGTGGCAKYPCQLRLKFQICAIFVCTWIAAQLTWMKTVNGDVCAFEPFCQLEASQNVRIFRVSVQKPWQKEPNWVHVVVLVRIHERPCMRLWSDDDNPGRRWLFQQIDQQMRQQERPVVVRCHRHLNSISANTSAPIFCKPRVVNQNVDLWLRSIDFSSKRVNRLERRKVHVVDDDFLVVRFFNNLVWNKLLSVVFEKRKATAPIRNWSYKSLREKVKALMYVASVMNFVY